MAKESAPCGVAVGDEVARGYDRRFGCPAINAGILHGLAGLHELGLPDDEKTEVVSSIDPILCAYYRGVDSHPDAHLGFPCPHVLDEVDKEVREMVKLGFSPSEVRDYIKLLHPAFQYRAEVAVWEYLHPVTSYTSIRMG